MRQMNKSNTGEAKLPGNMLREVKEERNENHQRTEGNGEMEDEAGPRQQKEKIEKLGRKE